MGLKTPIALTSQIEHVIIFVSVLTVFYDACFLCPGSTVFLAWKSRQFSCQQYWKTVHVLILNSENFDNSHSFYIRILNYFVKTAKYIRIKRPKHFCVSYKKDHGKLWYIQNFTSESSNWINILTVYEAYMTI